MHLSTGTRGGTWRWASSFFGRVTAKHLDEERWGETIQMGNRL